MSRTEADPGGKPALPGHASQRGYATLSVVSILALIFSALALSSAKQVITDANAGRNQVLARRALAAAEGGIDHGMAWLGAIDSATGSSHARLLADSWSAACDPATDPSPATSSIRLTTRIDEHAVEIGFTRQCLEGHDFSDGSANGKRHEILEITASASGDSSSSATVRQKVFLPRIVNPDFGGPALVINGCSVDPASGVSGIGGRIHVSDPMTRAALLTTSPVDGSGRLGGSSQPCIDSRELKAYDAATGSELPSLGVANFSGSAWNQVFGASRAQLKRAAGDNQGPALLRYYDPGQPAPATLGSLGSADQPAVIVFEGVCPRISGTIHGILYYSDGAACSGQELDGLTLYGSIVSETGIGGRMGSPTIHQQDYTSARPSFPDAIGAIRVAGSWRDF